MLLKNLMTTTLCMLSITLSGRAYAEVSTWDAIASANGAKLTVKSGDNNQSDNTLEFTNGITVKENMTTFSEDIPYLHYSCDARQGILITYNPSNKFSDKNNLEADALENITKDCIIEDGTKFKIFISGIVYNDAEGYAQCNAAYYAHVKITDSNNIVYVDTPLEQAKWCLDEDKPIIDKIQLNKTSFFANSKLVK